MTNAHLLPVTAHWPAAHHALPVLAALPLLMHATPANAACDDDAGDTGCTYAGVLVGSARAFNRIADIDGFAN